MMSADDNTIIQQIDEWLKECNADFVNNTLSGIKYPKITQYKVQEDYTAGTLRRSWYQDRLFIFVSTYIKMACKECMGTFEIVYTVIRRNESEYNPNAYCHCPYCKSFHTLTDILNGIERAIKEHWQHKATHA